MKVTRRQLRQIIKEAWGSYDRHRRVDDGKFWDTITTGTTVDSYLVDGRETHLDDVPSQITATSGIEMSDTEADNLIFALETQQDDGNVEFSIEYTDGKWSW